ncbi:excisionase [Enterobacter hormaechei subsp. xiangfangensis]|uniref:excisionase n=1 Tax=Enterobacter hormaechei TaxID=158836 RepID=UPI0007C94984|nr:excisionase [Enterobacter hormaechei]MBT2013295.1 excisionase [Enterobacter hormaechei subsp. xiangfangensis]MCW4840168.1 excisionase [Enterobacter hormaechei subsp. xiangfangensis]MDW2631561.1 excisionase [Enterobacter hormaechei]MDW2679300.1 excisionase [Enterobacter hormaechei]OAH35025.1 excisionase [Enterobacter hormaechei subsp. xiangfangensis]
MAKLLNLQEWAAEVYTTPPSLSTLRRWTRQGRIYPAPELHGKEYKVQPDAIYVDPRKKNLRAKPKHTKLPSSGTLLERLTHGEKASTLRR